MNLVCHSPEMSGHEIFSALRDDTHRSRTGGQRSVCVGRKEEGGKEGGMDGG